MRLDQLEAMIEERALAFARGIKGEDLGIAWERSSPVQFCP